MLNTKFIKSGTRFDRDYKGNVSAPLFRKKFKLNDIRNALLKICGLGYGYAFINGKAVTEDLFTAPVSNYDKMCWYNEYDVSGLLKKGVNVIAIICGCGFFNENFPSNWDNDKAVWRDNPKIALSLEINGKIVLRSDESFLCKENSFVTHNQLRSGETFDARLYDPDWKDVEYDDSTWNNAIVDNDFKPQLRLCECEPIRETKRYDFIDCKKTDKGYLLDFGQNMSGYVSAQIDAPEGSEIKFSHSEEVYPDGSLKLNGLNILYPTVDFQVDRYICGKVNYRWSPKFTYHGFRYILVEGLSAPPILGSIQAVFVHQAVKRTSAFECSDELLNKIYNAGILSTQSNMFYSLTDCPTREKFGWTNDAQASAEQILINFDCKRFFEKWIEDFKSNITEDGKLPAIVPTHGYGFQAGPVADGCLFEIPYRVYQYTGDSEMLIDCLPFFERYYNFFMSDESIDTDWLCDWDGFNNHDVDRTFIKAVYTIKFCEIIGLTYILKGKLPERRYSCDKLEAINELKKNLTIEGTSKIASQTIIATLICLGIGEKKKLIEQLKALIDKNNGHFNCGMFGIQYIYEALSQNGESEYAYKIITAKGEPGFSAWFERGATTLWETWSDSGFTDSRNHHMYSNVLAWFFKYLLGISCEPEHPAFSRVEIKPCFIDELDYCRGSVITPKGKLCVKWKRADGSIKLDIEVPEGICACFAGKELHAGENVFELSKKSKN